MSSAGTIESHGNVESNSAIAILEKIQSNVCQQKTVPFISSDEAQKICGWLSLDGKSLQSIKLYGNAITVAFRGYLATHHSKPNSVSPTMLLTSLMSIIQYGEPADGQHALELASSLSTDELITKSLNENPSELLKWISATRSYLSQYRAYLNRMGPQISDEPAKQAFSFLSLVGQTLIQIRIAPDRTGENGIRDFFVKIIRKEFDSTRYSPLPSSVVQLAASFETLLDRAECDALLQNHPRPLHSED